MGSLDPGMRSVGERTDTVERGAYVWLLPLAFIIHDGEELATRAGWLAANRETFHAMLQHFAGGGASALVGPHTFAGTALAMSVLLLIFTAATAAFWASPKRLFLYFYLVVLSAFLVHGFVHLAQSALFWGYTPGVITAASIVLPVSVYVWRRVARQAAVSRRLAAGALLLGAASILPAIRLALSIGVRLG